MGNKELQVFGISITIVSLLRYLALAVAAFGIIYTILSAVVAVGGATATAACFWGLLLTVFFGAALYGLSYLVQATGETGTIFWGISIISLLRGVAIAAVVIGLVYTIFAAVVAVGGVAAASTSFWGLLWTTFASAVLYALSCLLSAKAQPPSTTGTEL